MKIKLWITILALFAGIFSARAQDEIFWDQEKALFAGKIGKLEALSNSGVIVLIYADVAKYTKENKAYDLYMRYSGDGRFWSNPQLLIKEGFSTNTMGDDFSAALDNRNNLYITYRKNRGNLSIIRFSNITSPGTPQPEELISFDSEHILYQPVMYLDSSIYLLYNTNTSVDVYIEFKNISTRGELLSEATLGQSYNSTLNPVLVRYGSKLYVIFQAKKKGTDNTDTDIYYDLYAASSTDKGNTWNYTTISETVEESNQKPSVYLAGNMLHLVWEREDENYNSHIFYKNINLNSMAMSEDMRISDNISSAHSPSIFEYENTITIFWYDNISGSFQNHFAQYIPDLEIKPQLLAEVQGKTVINSPVLFKDNPVLLWNSDEGNQNKIYVLLKDNFVKPPPVYTRNVPATGITKNTSVTIGWEQVTDVSGIDYYNIYLTQDKNESILTLNRPLENFYPPTSSKTVNELSDGTWHAKVVAYDMAGNVSAESAVSFEVDTVPPEPPLFTEHTYDDDASLTTNSPAIGWDDESNEKLSLYRYYYTLLMGVFDEEEAESRLESIKKAAPSRFTTTRDTSIKLNELDNGLLLVGVRAYDIAGNLSDIRWQTFKLNDYIPRTYITSVTPGERTVDGKVLMNIRGRGYAIDGTVSYIYIDKDGKKPYDYVLDRSHFSVPGDRIIRQRKFVEIDDGYYYVGVYHPVRGTHFYPRIIRYESEWIFQLKERKPFELRALRFFSMINGTVLLITAGIVLWLIIIVLLLTQMLKSVRERRYIKNMLTRLESARQELTDFEYNRRREVVMKIKMSLTFKFAGMILLLVVLVITGTSTTLGVIALSNETKNLAAEIKTRVDIVMENMEGTLTNIFLFEEEHAYAINITDQTETVSKLPNIGFAQFRFAEGSTITRFGEGENVFFKEQDISDLDTNSKAALLKQLILNEDYLETIKKYQAEHMEKSEVGKDGEKTKNNIIKVYPEFNSKELNDLYIFTSPVYKVFGEEWEYMGEIIIGYSFESTLQLLESERNYLVIVTLLVSLVAVVISLIGAIFLASSTIRPIKKMSGQINVISKTEDYEKLVGTENEKLEVRAQDEIGLLADSINTMTKQLIEKSKADKQTMIGKEIQQKFIPLEPHETDYIDLHGFYNGAKGVSGDYFDYKKLDDQHYAFIICDVAGKAVPAALIMVQISTIFQAFFSNFKVGRDKLETVSVVTQINDTVAERGFTGRFAAILVVILNVKTGKMLMTNAGTTQLLVYRNKLKKSEWIKLDPSSGAAGVFPSFMLPNPYVQEKLQINHGDIIFLFTDGIEESRNGKTIITEEGDEQPEEFGLVRIKKVIDTTNIDCSKTIVDALMTAEKKFRGDLEQYDDLTVLSVRRK